MTVHYISPYSTDKNFGKAINDACSIVPDSDYICLRDGDSMFLTSSWGAQIEETIKRHGRKYSLICCLTNRLGRPIQRYKGEFSTNTDIMHHYSIAEELEREHWAEVEDITVKRRVAGMFMLFPKTLWNSIKFEENTAQFDDRFSNAVVRKGKKLGLMKGLYVFHFYRLNKNPRDTSHLK